MPSKAARTYHNPYHCNYPISPIKSHSPCIFQRFPNFGAYKNHLVNFKNC